MSFLFFFKLTQHQYLKKRRRKKSILHEKKNQWIISFFFQINWDWLIDWLGKLLYKCNLMIVDKKTYLKLRHIKTWTFKFNNYFNKINFSSLKKNWFFYCLLLFFIITSLKWLKKKVKKGIYFICVRVLRVLCK